MKKPAISTLNRDLERQDATVFVWFWDIFFLQEFFLISSFYAIYIDVKDVC